jgi:hypothetical protein
LEYIPFTNKRREEISTSSKNRIWINNGDTTKFIKEMYLEKFLNDGWLKGRLTPWQ